MSTWRRTDQLSPHRTLKLNSHQACDKLDVLSQPLRFANLTGKQIKSRLLLGDRQTTACTG